MIQDTFTNLIPRYLIPKMKFPPPKRRNVNKDYCLQRITKLQDKVKDIEDRIACKSKRRDTASKMRNCDELTEQMSN